MGLFKKLFGDAADELKKSFEECKTEMRRDVSNMRNGLDGMRQSASRVFNTSSNDDDDSGIKIPSEEETPQFSQGPETDISVLEPLAKQEIDSAGNSVFSERLEAMISAALQDGVLTDKERELLKKRVEKEGEDWDEVEMIIEARLAEMQTAVPATQAPQVQIPSKIDNSHDDRNDLSYRVVLKSIGRVEMPCKDALKAADKLREAFGIDSDNTYNLIKGGLPCTIMEGLSKVKAEYIKRAIESCGFIADIEETIGISIDESLPIIYKGNEKDKEKVSVVISEGVTELAKNAFLGFKMENITLPSTLTKINDNAFCGCEQLENITIPEGVETIPKNCFLGCNCLSNVALPASINRIESSAFCCLSLKSITIPMGCKRIKIARNAFSIHLKSIFLPPTLSSIRIGEGTRNADSIYCFSPSIGELNSLSITHFYVQPQFLEAYKAQAEAEQVTDEFEILPIPDEYLYYYDED